MPFDLFYNFVLNISHTKNKSAKYEQERMQCDLFLYDFNQNLNALTDY
jgi:hypothetical protein